jgi:aryl-alcohol dehydrogenase-like predicted oxidoreductase
MEYRAFGNTGTDVSAVGYGAWGIGQSQWIGADDDESIQALERAIELGVNFIDTARAYGDGHSERLVGQVVRARPERVYVATKVPPRNLIWPAPAGVAVDEVFPGEHIRRSAEESLANLGVDTIDLLQFHVWQDDWIGEGDWLEAVQELKADGSIRLFGISINDHQPETGLRAVRDGLVDSVQVIFNIFDQAPTDELFPACVDQGVAVIVRVALDEGGLTGRITADSEFPEGDFRNHYFGGNRAREVEQRVNAIAEELEIGADDMAATALRFVLSEPAVSTVIPGMRSLRNVDRNVAVADGRGLPPEHVAALRAHRWERNFYE